MLKVDKNTLEVKKVRCYRIPFYVLLAICITLSSIILLRDPLIVRHTRKIIKTDTVYLPDDISLNDSSITAELVKLGCVLPNVALAQFKIETGHFTSAICRENKNIAGIRNSSSPLSVGKNRGHNVYKRYKDCLKDYVRVQNKYLKNIDGHYAEAKDYIKVIRSIKK